MSDTINESSEVEMPTEEPTAEPLPPVTEEAPTPLVVSETPLLVTPTNKKGVDLFNPNLVPGYPEGLKVHPENYDLHIPADQQRSLQDVANQKMQKP